jgi:hypothetical protein
MYPSLMVPSLLPAALRPGRIAIALAQARPTPRAIADAIAMKLHDYGYVTTVSEVLASPAGDCDALVIGCTGDDDDIAALAEFLAATRAQLARVATALFVATRTGERGELADVVARLRWRPDLAAGLCAGDRRAPWFVRDRWPWLGHRDDVDRFATALGIGLARAALTGDLARLRLGRP